MWKNPVGLRGTWNAFILEFWLSKGIRWTQKLKRVIHCNPNCSLVNMNFYLPSFKYQSLLTINQIQNTAPSSPFKWFLLINRNIPTDFPSILILKFHRASFIVNLNTAWAELQYKYYKIKKKKKGVKLSNRTSYFHYLAFLISWTQTYHRQLTYGDDTMKIFVRENRLRINIGL